MCACVCNAVQIHFHRQSIYPGYTIRRARADNNLCACASRVVPCGAHTQGADFHACVYTVHIYFIVALKILVLSLSARSSCTYI